MLKMTLLASAMALALYGTAQASTPSIDTSDMLVKSQTSTLLQLADSGKGKSGSGNSGGSGDSDDNDSNDDNGADDSNDDNGGTVSGGGNSNDDNAQSVSGRKKKRIPGGSGCDDAGDIAEHSECSPN